MEMKKRADSRAMLHEGYLSKGTVPCSCTDVSVKYLLSVLLSPPEDSRQGQQWCLRYVALPSVPCPSIAPGLSSGKREEDSC